MHQQQAQSDPLKSYLDKLPIDQSVKADTWDAYQNAKTPQDLQSSFDKLNLTKDAKADLWDLKYPKAAPTPPSQPGGTGVSNPANIVPAPQGPPPSGSSRPPEVNKTWDQITGTLLPTALKAGQEALQYPIVSRLMGKPSYTEALQSSKLGQTPGASGMSTDAQRIALQTGAGLVDFAQSPTGIAAGVLEAATGGAATPWIAGAFTADQGSKTIEAYQVYKKNPTPENLQNVLVAGANTAAISAGGKAKEGPLGKLPVAKEGAFGSTYDRSKMAGPDTSPVAPTPSPAVAPPIPRGEGTSAVNLIDAPPSTSPEADAQSHTAEIQRMQSVIDNPKATLQERAYALDARAASIEARDNLARPRSRAEITDSTSGILPPRIAPEIAPEPVERGTDGLAPEHQEIVNRIESASGAPSAGVPPEEAANRKLVEDLGGEWKGSDSSGLSHFDVPEVIIGRKGVTISAPTDKLTSDYIKQQFDRKIQEFAPKPIAPDVDTQTRLNTLQDNSFRKIVELKNGREAATDDGARAIIDQQIKEELGRSQKIQDLRIQAAGPEGLQQLRDEHNQKSQWYKNRERGINNLQDVTERNSSTVKQISEMRSTRSEGEVYSEETGEKMSLDTGAALQPLARSIFDISQNRKPRYTLADLQLNAPKKGVDPAEWKTFTDNMLGDLQKRYAEITRDITIHQDTQSTNDLIDTDIPERIRELDKDASLIGQFDKHLRQQKLAGIRTDVGRRPHLAPPVDADGNITDPAALWTMDQRTWDKITGVNARKGVPESNEVRQFAKNQGLFGKLHDMARAHVDKVFNPIKQAALAQASQVVEPRNPEAGFVGDRAPKPFQVPDSKTLVKRAIDAGIVGTHTITEEKPAGYEGWITKDGKGWIGRGDSHPSTASAILPEVPKTPENIYAAMESMLKDGAIRKVNPTAFEVHELTSKAIDLIEMDAIRGGRHGHDLLIDTSGPNGAQTLHIDRGWENLTEGIREAKTHGYIDPTPNSYNIELDSRSVVQPGFTEAGKVPGAINLGAASIGAVGGHIVGGPLGAVAGFTLGYISPELIRFPFVQDSFKSIEPFLTRVGVDAKDWVYGSKRPDAIIPQMKDIIDQQRRDPEGSGLGYLERLAQLPTDARRYLINKFAILDDQRTRNFTSALSKFDTRLPKGPRPSIDNSPYVSLADAAGLISGQKDFNIIQFSKIYNDAMKAGLDTHLQEYLNLKGYKRVYEVLQERVQDGINQIKAIDKKLSDPDISARARMRLEDDRQSVKDDANAAFKKMKGDDAVPGGIKYTDLPDMFNQLSQALGPQKMQQIDGWAQSVFKYGRQALNMAHDNGVIGDVTYNKLVARGDEYINMSRIMSDLADNYAKYDKQGKSSPMYLNKQNIIRNLEGSERVNQSPLKANMMINNEMIAESFRNKVVGEFIKRAEAQPDMYGPDEFKKVKPDYQPVKGEAIVTHYEDGKPVQYKVSQAIYESLQGAAPINHDIASTAMKMFYNTFRLGATGLNLGFQLVAMPAEIMRTRVLSDANISGNWMKFGRMWGKNFAASLTHSPEWQEAVNQGYLFSGMQRLISPEMKLESASLGVGQKIARLRILSAAEDLIAARSDATKMTGFQMLREQGYSEKAARYETKRFVGMPDYSQSGAAHPAVRLATMFFNADLQHLAQSMNRLADKPERILPILGAVTAMTMALQQWNYSQKDEDGQPLMRKVPFDERDRNFVILTGGTHQVSSGSYTPNRLTIRKPDIIAYTVNPVENLISKAIGHEERSTRSIIADATKGITPFSHGSIGDDHPVRDAARAVGGSVNPVLRLPLEEAANKNFGTGSPIVSRDQIDPRYQATSNTPSLYSRVGEATGMSPQRIQHVASGVTGGLADTVAQQVDPLLRGNKPAPLPGSPTAKRQIPIVGQAAARLTGSNIDQEEQTQTTRFYDRAEQFKQVQQTFDYLAKSNPAKAQEFAQQNKKMLALSSTATEAKSSLAELGQMRSEVQSNPRIDEQTRSTQLANIAKARMRYLKAYNSVFDKYTK